MKSFKRPLSCRLSAKRMTGSSAAIFARERRILLLRSTKGVGLDVALGALPYEALVIERSSYLESLTGITSASSFNHLQS